ncbi:hypothetical protein GCM10027072_13860 [Streptomyces bullii]
MDHSHTGHDFETVRHPELSYVRPPAFGLKTLPVRRPVLRPRHPAGGPGSGIPYDRDGQELR